MADRQNSRHRNETNRDLPPPNPMPPPAAVAAPANDADDRILAGALETARDIREFRAPDRTYAQAWANFKKFINGERRAGKLSNGKHYLTRTNVDLWFSDVIRKKNYGHAHARRNVCALQYYADHLEHVREKFIVDSEAIKIALEGVRTNRTRASLVAQERINEDNLPNPYADLPTNNISSHDIEKIMKFVLTNCNDGLILESVFCGVFWHFYVVILYVKVPGVILS